MALPTILNVENGDHARYQPPIFVFDYMRTRSHLFWRWISTHPSLKTEYHPYLMAGMLGLERITQYTRNSEKRKADWEVLIKSSPTGDTFTSSTRVVEGWMREAAKEGKRLFTNEHIICLVEQSIQLDMIRKGAASLPNFDQKIPNPLYIPDGLLNKLTPIILIRHPILQVDSVYKTMLARSNCRTGDEDFHLITSTLPTRLIFEYLRQTHSGCIPIVVDGEDILYRTQQLGQKLCAALRLDPTQLKDSWDPIPEWKRHQPEFVAAMTATMTESTGIERLDKQPEAPTLDKYMGKWTEKYGRDVAEQLKERVELAMPHYDYIVQFKL